MTNKEIFQKAKKLIQKGWCKKAGARDKKGNITDAYSSNAVKFCTIGAIYKVTDGVGTVACYTFKELVGISDLNLGTWNDRQPNKKTVLKAFDKAIKGSK